MTNARACLGRCAFRSYAPRWLRTIRDHAVAERQRSFSHSVQLSNANSRTKLFIGGLSYDTNETVLKDAFGRHGEIIEVKVICDRVDGQSRGYGFVKFTSEAAARKAIKEMDGLLLDGRNIRVNYAQTD